MHSRHYVIMGVSGAGKSVIGAALAKAIGVPFVEGDQYHDVANVQRMAAGTPLTDDDRQGWLRRLGDVLATSQAGTNGLVISCSALKRSYRDVLRERADVRFVYLRGARGIIAERLCGRADHFMPIALLDSQFAALEEPTPDEAAWVCDVDEEPATIVATLLDLIAHQ